MDGAEVKSGAAAMLWQVYHHRPRTQRAKVLTLSLMTFVLFLWMLRSLLKVSDSLWTYPVTNCDGN